ncbi:MAG TPA: winged helix-turn-helix domain-containing protein [Solirubrobacterales bacterium]|nr:winged helix-turn-helix domain-containing protein [Solirubrobacterales bacterium]
MAEGVLQLSDPRALRAVAHPTRLKLLGELRRVGPLTATQAGERIGESPAACSFHLRLLAKWGLVEEAGGGRGRARPWRATAMGHEWSARGPSGEPEEASDILSRVVIVRWFEESFAWIGRRAEETEEWSEAAILGDRLLYLTPAELEDLNRRIGKLLEPYARRVTDPAARPEEARAVTFIQLAFPLDDEGPADEDDPGEVA